MDTTLEHTFEMVEYKHIDSLDLPLPKINEWDNRGEWCKGLAKLDKSITEARDILKEDKRKKELEEYKAKGSEVAIYPIGEDDDIAIIETNKTNPSTATFIVDYPAYIKHMEKALCILGNMVQLSLESAPRDHLISIINILVAICIEYNVVNQNAHNTIKEMAEVIEELLPLKKKVKEVEEDREIL